MVNAVSLRSLGSLEPLYCRIFNDIRLIRRTDFLLTLAFIAKNDQLFSFERYLSRIERFGKRHVC